MAAGLALTAIALVKTAGAVVPLLVEAGLLRGRRWWRRTEWVGALLLVGYGAANMLGAWWQLSGIPKPPADLTATRGHAFLWDPLFCAWGLLLLLGLRSTAGDSADLIRQRPNG